MPASAPASTQTGRLAASMRPRADFDCPAAQPLDRGETELVGNIVSDEHGQPTAERRLLHIFENCGTLVHAVGENLDDAFAALQAQVAAFRCEPRDLCAHDPMHVRREAWHEAIVKRQRRAFVLENETGVARGKPR